ncbi:MAG: UTP--glucose-1-phosphate uridylyltransferase [Proteobacteria bacterium]|nr:UTP--glucose-1-phosphate uridylyltransferase [Pseudomonadota bacterium]
MKPIRKAIFPVAGLGTRFLPATKAMPKEMLPVVDRPLIQHVVDEARAAGIEHFIFVTGRNKGVIEDHFDRQYELEQTLGERARRADLALLAHDLPGPGQTSFTRQQSPLGLGHAVWCAREIVGNEPFALLLPDVLVQAPHGCLAQMIDAYRDLGPNANIVAVEEVAMERIHMYGVVGVGRARNRAFEITQMVEKPAREQAPSNLSITGRYILQPEIFWRARIWAPRCAARLPHCSSERARHCAFSVAAAGRRETRSTNSRPQAWSNATSPGAARP